MKKDEETSEKLRLSSW